MQRNLLIVLALSARQRWPRIRRLAWIAMSETKMIAWSAIAR